ncbi:IucA/IucC family protein [Streptomyces sp. B-S-A8]|uniref:IucA/IucC family protein n=1 Tax=Streptomyces solicavernae TaxID=3043614 RepID=A0ABT6RRE1_9ACTN|nr:IucA/IucC family protein [Streptomyces sp. B-S-A8]MDI3386989.1 IucA/IucC family protein [Streptomyces sp. B-S-A8]
MSSSPPATADTATAVTATADTAAADTADTATADTAADAAATENLLRCWIRETAVPRPADDLLTVPLPASGVTVEAPVRYWSPVGWHRFGPAHVQGTGTPLAASALAALIAVETAAADPAQVADLTGRVADSTRRTAEFVRQRAGQPADPEGTTAFLAAEQALITGHPLHPTPKSREGLTDAELGAYSPELRGSFALHWFAADPSVISADSTLAGRTAQGLMTELAEDSVRAPEGTVLVPAHPWQAKDIVTRPAVRALLDAGLLHDLGRAGPEWSPTSSVRTLYRADAPVMLKFSLGLRITNSRRENMRVELERGAAVDRLLAAGLGDTLRAEHPGFDIVRDPAWIAVDATDGSPTGLDVVVRDNPFPASEPVQAVCAAGLVAPRPDLGPDAPSQLATVVRGLAERTGRSITDVAEDWFDRYLQHIVTPVLWLYATYGLGLEAHQQNTLVVLDEEGRPAGGRYRDNQGYYFSPTRSTALYGWVPEVGRDLGTYVDDEIIDERLAYYVGINNMLGMVGALGSQGLADEDALLRRAADTLGKLAAEHGDRLRLATTLRTAATLRCKANLLTRVHGMDELTGPLEAQSVYVDLANPLAGAAR